MTQKSKRSRKKITLFGSWMSAIGFDSLRYLGSKEPISKPKEYPSTEEINSRIRKITSSKKVDFAISFCEKRSGQLEENYKSAQTKAFTLMSAAGISTSFIVGFSNLLLNTHRFSKFPLGTLFPTMFFALTIASLVLTVIFAAKTVAVAEYYYPDHDDVYDLAAKQLAVFKNEYVANLIDCLNDNTHVLSVKMEYLVFSQKWFRNSISLLFVISVMLASAAVFP